MTRQERDLSSVTNLHWAAQAGDVEQIVRLVQTGTDVDAQDDCGNTPLKYASAEPHPRAIQKLLELGATVDLADNRGFTPLHCASAHGFYDEALEMTSILIQHGANVNARSHMLGLVPLHESRGTKIIDLLLAHGAVPSARNDRGLAPVEYMIEQEHFEEAEHLKMRIASGL